MGQNQTYLVVLIDTLKKKLSMLDELMEMTKYQGKLISEEKVDSDEFDGLFISKQEVIDRLNKADEGFELIYERVKEELTEHPALHEQEISIMKKLITEITEKSISLQAEEQHNHNAMELYFANQRRSIRNTKKSQQGISHYYKSMAGAGVGQSYYMDRKK